MCADNNQDDLEDFRNRVDAVTRLLRRRPHNMIEEIEKFGFKWHVDEDEDADEIAEENMARPANLNERRLVLFLESHE